MLRLDNATTMDIRERISIVERTYSISPLSSTFEDFGCTKILQMIEQRFVKKVVGTSSFPLYEYEYEG